MKNYQLKYWILIFSYVIISCNDKVTKDKTNSIMNAQQTDDDWYKQRFIQDYKLIFLSDCIFDNLYDQEAINAFNETDGSFITDFRIP